MYSILCTWCLSSHVPFLCVFSTQKWRRFFTVVLQMIFSASVISLLFMLILLTYWMFILKKSVPMISRFTCSHRVYMNLAIIEVWWCTYPSILKEKTHDICCFYKLRPLCKIIPVHLLGFILYNCTKQMLNILHRWFTFYILYTSFKNLVNLVFFAHFNIYHLSAVSICISLFVIVYALKTISCSVLHPVGRCFAAQ